MQISPRAKIKTSGAKSFWHFQGVDVIALSLDWFRHESDAEQLQQPNPRSEPSLGVRVSMSDCVLRSMKCATPPENDMAQSWLTTISEGNDSAVQVCIWCAVLRCGTGTQDSVSSGHVFPLCCQV